MVSKTRYKIVVVWVEIPSYILPVRLLSDPLHIPMHKVVFFVVVVSIVVVLTLKPFPSLFYLLLRRHMTAAIATRLKNTEMPSKPGDTSGMPSVPEVFPFSKVTSRRIVFTLSHAS